MEREVKPISTGPEAIQSLEQLLRERCSDFPKMQSLVASISEQLETLKTSQRQLIDSNAALVKQYAALKNSQQQLVESNAALVRKCLELEGAHGSR